jgi:hypothetical protein
VRYFLSDLLLIIDRSDFCFATVFAWRSPLSFLSPDASWRRFPHFCLCFIFSSWLLCDIRESDHPRWYNPLFVKKRSSQFFLFFKNLGKEASFSILFLSILNIDKRRFCNSAQLFRI